MVRSVTCRVCKVNKESTEFWKQSKSKTGYQDKCKQCFRNYQQKNIAHRRQYIRKWSSKNTNKDKARSRRLNRVYKITQDQFTALIEVQQGKCLICCRLFSDKRKPVIDHNHASGKMRGILCNGCNFSLGIFQDSVAQLQRVIQYLQNDGKVDL